MWGKAAVLICAVALMAGCSAGRSSDDAPTTVPRGSTGQSGGLTISVDDAWTQKAIGNDPDRVMSYHEPRGVWVVVQMHVENESNESARYDSTFQNLLIDGREYSSNSFAADDVDRKLRGSASLNPGFGEDVVAVFDVPEDETTKPMVIKVRAGFGDRAVLMAVPNSVAARSGW